MRKITMKNRWDRLNNLGKVGFVLSSIALVGNGIIIQYGEASSTTIVLTFLLLPGFLYDLYTMFKKEEEIK